VFEQGFHGFGPHNCRASCCGFLKDHSIKLASANLPGRSRRQSPLRGPRKYRDKPRVHPVRAVNLNAMFHRITSGPHFVLEAEAPQHLASLSGHRFANMKTREFFLFEDDWLDTFAEQEHGRHGAARATTDDEDVRFHSQKTAPKL